MNIDTALIIRLGNFLVFFILLVVLLKKPLKEFFASRAATIRVSVEEAKKFHTQALKEYQEINHKLKKADEEMADLIKTFKEAGETQRNKMTSQAKELAQKIEQDTQKLAEVELKKAKESLKETAIEMATKLGREMVEKRITENDKKRLTENYLSQINT